MEKSIPSVHPGLVEVPEATARMARQIVTANGTPDLESGPYRYTDNDPSETYGLNQERSYDLHAAQGPIAHHIDGAGQTFGLVLVAEGTHKLVVYDSEMPLEAGTVFHIDSDRMHGTRCDDTNGLLIFITSDWLGAEPDQSYAEFAKNALSSLHKGCLTWN